ncbi:MAG: tail fiber domain-containing protein [Verrucomicrobiota bacterium]
MRTKLAALLLLSLLVHQLSTNAHAQGTAFTYQGRLDDGASPATGIYDLRFTIYDAASAGILQGSALTNAATPVTNGLFMVTLNFGAGVFDGNARWLEIGVQPADGTNFATLSPRQALTATPYAQFSGRAATAMIAASANAVPGANIHGQVPLGSLPPSVLTNGAAFAGDGTGVTNVNATTLNGQSAANFWQLGGNAATPGQFLGTTNTQAMEVWAGNQRALRLEPTYASAPNVIAGASVNYVAGGVAGATIAGGGATNYYGGRYTNSVTADFGVVGGGWNNAARGMQSTIGGGYNNAANQAYGTIAGGGLNTANGMFGTIGGGYNNAVSNQMTVVAGGQNNLAGGMYATVSGGNGGQATNSYATVPGGFNNVAGGQNSFAAGHMARATNDGSFVWADNSSSMPFNSISNNEFAVRAAGGVRLVTGGAGLSVDGLPVLNNIATGNNSLAFGVGATATNSYAVALGYVVSANGYYSTALGFGTIASGAHSTAMGDNTQATGDDSTALGYGTLASGDYSTALGSHTTTSGRSSTAMGWGTTASGYYSTALGYETIAGDRYSTAMGYQTTATNWASTALGYGTLASGSASTALGSYTTASGGSSTAMGYASTASANNSIAIGWEATASGLDSFAAGTAAKAMHDGSFVWADLQSGAFNSTTTNQFLIRAQNGVGINTNDTAGAALRVNGTIRADGNIIISQYPGNLFIGGSDENWSVIKAEYGKLTINKGGWNNVVIPTGYVGIGITNPAHLLQVDNAYCDGNTWSPSSDRNLKGGFAAISAGEILAKVAALPISSWFYTNNAAATHIGPMAQDFHAAFGLNGPDDKHITDVDEGGVALAAIQGLNQKLEQKDAKLAEQAAEIEALKQSVAELKQLVQTIVAKK